MKIWTWVISPYPHWFLNSVWWTYTMLILWLLGLWKRTKFSLLHELPELSSRFAIHSTNLSSRTAKWVRHSSQHPVPNSRSSGSLSLTLGLCWGKQTHPDRSHPLRRNRGLGTTLRRQPSVIIPTRFFIQAHGLAIQTQEEIALYCNA